MQVLPITIRRYDCVLVLKLAYELLQVLILDHGSVSDQIVRRSGPIIQRI